MPKQCEKGLTKTDRGYCRTIGYYCHDRKRMPRKFRLGYDRAEAIQKLNALTQAWDELPGERGSKVWTEEAIRSGMEPTVPMTNELVLPVVVPVIPARRFVATDAPVTYTILTALDEFKRYFANRNDISDIYRRSTQARIDSIKLHLEEVFIDNADGTRTWLKDLALADVDMEWLGRIRNKIADRPMTKHVYDTPKGKLQLIDASSFWQKMRKSLGSKRKELSPDHIDEITRLFGQFKKSTKDGVPISRIFKNEDFGYRTITVERPLRDDKGNIILSTNGKTKGQPQPDASLRDTENVPLAEDVETYFKREVLPHAPDAWIDPDKTQVGYEIPFNRHIYVFRPPRDLATIDAELKTVTDKILTLIGGLSK